MRAAAAPQWPDCAAFGDVDEPGSEPMAPPQTDWLPHLLTISGPADTVARFRAAARGTNAAPWSLDLEAEEERLFAPMASEGAAARALARELCEVIAANHERALAGWHEMGTCPLDLHRLVPVPGAVLNLGEDHPRARVWLWANWGTTQKLRDVRLVEEAADRRGRRTRRDVIAFCSADWTPWQAVKRIRRDWPRLVLTVAPRYDLDDRGCASA